MIDNMHTNTGPVRYRLHHIGLWHDIVIDSITQPHDLMFDNRHLDPGDSRFAKMFVHGQRRSKQAGMGIGNFHGFKNCLYMAVLAPFAMQRVEGHIRFQIRAIDR